MAVVTGMLIPRIIHRVWLGPDPLPEEFRRYGDTWREHHPDWEMRLWTDDALPEAVDHDALRRSRHHAERADVVRYDVLREFGGVYVDTDVECLRSIEPILEGVAAFAGYESDDRVCNAVLGAVPHHPMFERAAREAAGRAGEGRSFMEATAVGFLTELVQDFPDVKLFDREMFYPYAWYEEHLSGAQFANAYAIHHWAKSWSEEPDSLEEKVEFLRAKLARQHEKRSHAERRAKKLGDRLGKRERKLKRLMKASRRQRAELKAITSSRWFRAHPARVADALIGRFRRAGARPGPRR